MPWTQGRGVAWFRVASVTNKALTSNVVTLTTAAVHGYTTGDVVTVSIGDVVFDGVHTITSTPTTTTFTYAKVNANVASTGASGKAAIDHSAELTEIVFDFSKELNEIPATFGTDDADIETGSKERNLNLGFMTALSATSFWETLRASFEATGETNFDILLEGLTVSTNNPRRTGTMLVNSLTTGGDVGALRTQTQTYRIKPGTYVKAST